MYHVVTALPDGVPTEELNKKIKPALLSILKEGC